MTLLTDLPAPPSVPAPDTPAPPPRRPDARFMLSHPAHFIALGFGSGLSRVAPGTAGTLWAWLSFLVLQRWLTPPQIGWLIALSV
ncbi:MAG: phosphatidylglycerophosphatase A, partial [Polaromonas sp.]